MFQARLFRSVALLIPLLPAVPTEAAEQVQRPWGLFVCRGPSPTPDREVAFPFVRGWLVRPGWNQIEPEEGRYDWTYIDNEIAHARKLNKKIALALLGGPQAPAWLYRLGTKKFTFRFKDDFTGQTKDHDIPVLWDAVYLKKWLALIQAAAKRYADSDTIVLVHMTAAGENGLEMQLPHSAEDQKRWREIGFTPERAIEAWKQVIDAFAKAFPRCPLDVDVHPVLGTDRVAREVAEYGQHQLRKRFGVFGGWLSGRPADRDRHHAGMHALAGRYGKEGFAAFQMIASQSRQPERFENKELRSAIDQGLSWGACYFEVWELDVVEPRLHPELNRLADKMAQAARQRPTLK